VDFEYRTKPVRVEACEWRPEAKLYLLPHWLWGAMDLTHNRTHGKIKRVNDRLQVTTANGTVMADPGDWIVFYTSTTSELEVFKPTEFRKLFEKSEDFRRTRLRSTLDDERRREQRFNRAK
jgi:hypothetical protein